MPSALESLDSAIQEATNTRALVAKIRTRQVRGTDHLATLKSVSYAWFKKYRAPAEAELQGIDLSAADAAYHDILYATERDAARSTYLGALTRAKSALLELRTLALTATKTRSIPGDDASPDFSPLVGTAEMREILSRRWEECRRCVAAEAHLAAIVMMGGLLEAMFVARANQMADKGPLIKAASAPVDRQTGKVINYQDWMLDSYIKVGHELEWISDAARQVADILKEFRNYVHPAKELRHGVNLAYNDSQMLWSITKVLVRQLLASAGKK
jgi:hypothetical protein